MQRGGDLLLLRGDLVRLAELLAETLLAREVQAAVAEPVLALAEWALAEVSLPELSLPELTEARVAETGIAELLTDSLMRAIGAHHSSPSEHRGRQGLREERCVVSVRQ